MSGYVASARIVRAAPHLIRREPEMRRPAGAAWDRADRAEARIVEVSGSADPAPRGVSIAERCDRLRDRFAQLTFYLMSPESWR